MSTNVSSIVDPFCPNNYALKFDFGDEALNSRWKGYFEPGRRWAYWRGSPALASFATMSENFNPQSASLYRVIWSVRHLDSLVVNKGEFIPRLMPIVEQRLRDHLSEAGALPLLEGLPIIAKYCKDEALIDRVIARLQELGKRVKPGDTTFMSTVINVNRAFVQVLKEGAPIGESLEVFENKCFKLNNVTSVFLGF